ncbi:PPOX class F420-dependent oxidoreductase [Terracoccus luteus]|uniref:Pyridoxamine 5'-phosphate oxidase N-terminal domain-containing protein n=1 Tax=Terracoccus luteus TaxID=53356 RepID=A0A839PWM0_9MICO|nr:PPOX class F420-dependent oxidoreductase [Terracoccus luteus]MBB2988480.1 hypothetical protein [Terracoccus luteus]MCP2174115.1 hypothetical protein [Terracoccus luteus]
MASEPGTPASDLDVVAAMQYVSLTTFRKTGAPVSTPVWIARDGDELAFVTVDPTGKTKRLANDPRVEMRPCDMRGNVPDGAPVHRGTARVVRGDGEVAAVRRAIERKYPMARVAGVFNTVTFGAFLRAKRAGVRIRLAVDD